MAETTADVKRDIELTRTRLADTLQELEQRLNVAQIVRDNPWPALALAVGAGVLLSGSRADVKAAAATAVATRGASQRIGGVLDDLVSQVMQGFHVAVERRVEGLAADVQRAISGAQSPSATSSGSAGFTTNAPRAD
jgi:hypothetical protein